MYIHRPKEPVRLNSLGLTERWCKVKKKTSNTHHFYLKIFKKERISNSRKSGQI